MDDKIKFIIVLPFQMQLVKPVKGYGNEVQQKTEKAPLLLFLMAFWGLGFVGTIVLINKMPQWGTWLLPFDITAHWFDELTLQQS